MTTRKVRISDLPAGPLNDHLKGWLTKYANRNRREASDKYKAINELIEDFAKFSVDYWTYLHKLVEASTERTNKAKFYDYQITRRLVHEWIEIGHVLEQRENDPYATWLNDLVAYAKDLLPNSLGPKNSAVVAYMGSSTELRHLSYSRVSIVSLPYDIFGNDSEALMSLAHELGHHVWRLLYYTETRGTTGKRIPVDAKDLAQQEALSHGATRENSVAVGTLVYSWMKELFADVYGAYALFQRDGETGTRKFVESYVNLLQGQIENKKELLANDGDHPFPYLRPIIRAHVQSYLTGSPSILDRGDFGWKRFLEDLTLTPEKEVVGFAIPSEPRPKGSTVASVANQALPQEHEHEWIKYYVPLVIVQKAVEAVIDKVVLPKVVDLWNELEFPSQPAFTFQWWRESAWVFGADATLEELLTATISLQQGQDSAGDSSSGLVCGSHTHAASVDAHTHTC